MSGFIDMIEEMEEMATLTHKLSTSWVTQLVIKPMSSYHSQSPLPRRSIYVMRISFLSESSKSCESGGSLYETREFPMS